MGTHIPTHSKLHTLVELKKLWICGQVHSEEDQYSNEWFSAIHSMSPAINWKHFKWSQYLKPGSTISWLCYVVVLFCTSALLVYVNWVDKIRNTFNIMKLNSIYRLQQPQKERVKECQQKREACSHCNIHPMQRNHHCCCLASISLTTTLRPHDSTLEGKISAITRAITYLFRYVCGRSEQRCRTLTILLCCIPMEMNSFVIWLTELQILKCF